MVDNKRVLSAIPAGFPSQHLISLDTRFLYSRQTQDKAAMAESRRIGQNQYVSVIMQSNEKPSYPCLKGCTLRLFYCHYLAIGYRCL